MQYIMTNRLVLNLSHTYNSPDESARTASAGLPSLSFASGPVLGNIGAPLRGAGSGVEGRFEIDTVERCPISEGVDSRIEVANEE